MALKNKAGNYLRITSAEASSGRVFYEIFKSSAIRDSPTDFDAAISGSMRCGKFNDEASKFASTGDLLTDIVMVGYLALKHEPPFNGASGETWSDC